MRLAFKARSIASRLFLAAAFWSASILIIAGVGLAALNAGSTEAGFDDTLELYLKALVTNVAVTGEEGRAASTARGGAAVRARLLRLVLADHSARFGEARHPHLEVAVRLAAAAAARIRGPY